MTYTVLARRYRSQDFGEVIGQAAIADTLRRAVEGDRTAHAYLFTGTRGVGKTTLARLFARAMNVADDLKDAAAIAEAIMRGDDLDVIEIDGASNRGVQEARDLIAGAGLSPARCKYRIYIIDEVHMLTTESFNTLLKTMEEPPEHVKFILCTTEPQKVLPTIQSRCQRFDFKPIPRRLIAGHLRSVLAQEGVEMDDAAIGRVAELGNGSMRDALSVMDRVLAGGDTSISAEKLEEMLGLPETGLIDAVISAIASGDSKAALEAADALLAGGTSIDQALAALTESLRRMLLLRTCGSDTEVLDLTDEARESLSVQAEQFEPASLVHGIAVCEAAARQGRLGASARAVFDAALVRLALAAQLIDPASVPSPIASGGTKKKRSVERSEPKPNSKTAKPKPAAKAKSKAKARETPPPASETLEQIWARLVASASGQAAKATFDGIEPIRFDVDLIIVRSSTGPMSRLVLERLTERLSDAAGRGIRVESDEFAEQPSRSPQQGGTTHIDDPRVDLAMELFDASVVDVKKHNPREEQQDV
ncbi:MAG: DNA polymerase III subunit gamma/tau [Phycisphaerales bacterium]|nr:DNA polymerase III subunit gamma/tau [Phycisphaerales bacterium]MDP6890630.1 DNA polymerase III subunit gamma/tau [Phycisphaerales bacterium]